MGENEVGCVTRGGLDADLDLRDRRGRRLEWRRTGSAALHV